MPPRGVRLSELVASLSLAVDLGLGQPQEHVLRQTVIATRLATIAGYPDEEVAATFYVSLLAWVGCVADSHEMSQWFGDDTQLRSASFEVDRAGLPMLRFLLGQLATGGSSFQRISMVGRFMSGGLKEVMSSLAAHCETTADVAGRLGVADQVRRALPQVFERFDGKGPQKRKGEQIERVMRVAHIANDSEVFSRVGGVSAALEMLRDRKGSQFDPKLVDICLANSDDIYGDLDEIDAWTIVIEGCKPLDRRMDENELGQALETLGDLADVKSPWFLGHARAVSTLAARAAKHMRLRASDVELVERAALVARLGTIGVSAGIWGKTGRLSASEQERVRTVPYLTERVLARQPRLAQLGRIAAMLYERIDGSGYPSGLAGGAIPRTARVLAAAEVYQALREARPHRDALSPERAKEVLLAEADAGRLDGNAVNAVLRAAGHRTRKTAKLVAGLTEREAEVLQHLVRGRSNKEAAEKLSISAKTVATHIEHIYTKIGVSTRGAAAMYAMHHGLIEASPSDISVE